MVSFSPPLGTMSDIPPKADIGTQSCNVRFVPEMEVASGLGGAALHSPTLPDLAGRADHYLSTTTGRMRLKLSAGHEMPRCHVSVLPSDRCQVEYQFHNLILRPQARHDNLAVSRALFKAAAEKHPGRLVMLCDRARVLARSDQPETWTKERLVQAALDELVRHGGNQRDAQQLQAEIQKAFENKPQDEDSSLHTGDIPD